MVSSAPVVSPTLIIWHTMGGKTLLSMSGSAIVCPFEMLWRAFMIAYSTTLLPAVRAVMVSASRMGTPEERHAQQEAVDRHVALLGLVGVADGEPGDDRDRRQVPDVIDGEVREVDDELGGRGQRVPEALEHLGEDRDHPDEEHRGHGEGRGHDARRVDHRALDLALQLDGLLEVVGETDEDRVEDAADLAGLH